MHEPRQQPSLTVSIRVELSIHVAVGQISKTLSTTLQRDSLRADVDRLTSTLGDLEAGTQERSLKQKQQHETSAKHAEVWSVILHSV